MITTDTTIDLFALLAEVRAARPVVVSWADAALLPADATVDGCAVNAVCPGCLDRISRRSFVRTTGETENGEIIAQHARCWDLVWG